MKLNASGADAGSYVVMEQRQLDAKSFLRIPVALVTMLGTLAAVLAGGFYVARLAFDGPMPRLLVFLLVGGAVFVAIRAATRVSRLIRSKSAMIVALSGDQIRYRREGEDERSFPNRDVTRDGVSPLRLRVRSAGAVHELPIHVVPHGDPGKEFYKLGVVGGQVRVVRVSLATDDMKEDALLFG